MTSRDRRTIRVLLVADTHIGFDLPVRPRVSRRRRGSDFVANFERALSPARAGDVDLVVHGGDLLDRSRPPTAVVEAALAPLARVADAGIPVVVIPGNHERSRVPRVLASARPGMHILDRPATVRLTVRGLSVAVSGFPFSRLVAEEIGTLVDATGWQAAAADIRLLCLHQTVEGATVGPADHVFRRGPDVIAGRSIPAGFAAVLAGHIHRQQTLRADTNGRPMAAPVVYPGSVERTSFAEAGEEKGSAIVTVADDGPSGGRVASIETLHLHSRPMVTLDIHVAGRGDTSLAVELHSRLAALPEDAVVRVRLHGWEGVLVPNPFRAENLRAAAPNTMNVGLSLPAAAVRNTRASTGPTATDPRPGEVRVIQSRTREERADDL